MGYIKSSDAPATVEGGSNASSVTLSEEGIRASSASVTLGSQLTSDAPQHLVICCFRQRRVVVGMGVADRRISHANIKLTRHSRASSRLE